MCQGILKSIQIWKKIELSQDGQFILKLSIRSNTGQDGSIDLKAFICVFFKQDSGERFFKREENLVSQAFNIFWGFHRGTVGLNGDNL